jgi:nucleotide-binding universal stress UspA family protein
MAQIVVTGVDGSDTANRAAMAAGRLAAALGIELHAICAYERGEVEVVHVGSDEFELSTQASAQTVVDDVARALGASYPSLSITGVAMPGKPAEVLVSYAEKEAAEIIVVGNKRVQGVSRILGSIATDVAHKAPCDVYIAHTHER